MVLAACLGAVALAPVGRLEPQVVPLQPRVLGTIAEMVDDPNNAGQKVSAQVRYTLKGQLVATPEGAINGPTIHRFQGRPDLKFDKIRFSASYEQLPEVSDRTYESILQLVPKATSEVRDGVEGALSDYAKRLGDAFLGEDEIDPNIGLQIGGWTIRDYAIVGYSVSARYELDREISYSHATPNLETLQVPAIDCGTLRTVGKVPADERFVADPKPGDSLSPEQIEVLRNWGGGAITTQMGTLEGLGYIPLSRWEKFPMTANVSLAQYGKDALAGILNITGKPIVSPELLLNVNGQSVETLAGSTTFAGEDMNKLGYRYEPNSFPNCTGVGDSYFPPGTLWLPDHPGYQPMSNYQPVSIHMNFSPFAAIDPGAFAEGEFRTHCMNMTLKEPAAGVKYFPYRSTNPVIAGLMELTANSRVRGPWDQARMWIYTNKAGLDVINERLFPEISAAQFLTSIKQVAELGGLEKQDFADKKLFVPKLLAGRGMALGTMTWGFGILDAQQPKELGSWLAGYPEDLGRLLAGDDSDREQLASMFRLALGSGSSEVRQGALKALLKKPKGLDALGPKFGGMVRSLMSKNAAEVEMALDSAAAYGAAAPKEALQYLVAQGANAKIKQKAAALLGG